MVRSSPSCMPLPVEAATGSRLTTTASASAPSKRTFAVFRKPTVDITDLGNSMQT